MDNPHGIEVHLHPVAAFSIVDSHERRGKDNQRRVVGSLLGTINKGVYEVHSAYPVLHNETDEEVEFDSDYEQKMYRIHQTVNPSDMVIGWYATNSLITQHSVLIHDYYIKREPPPIHLTFDCKMKSGHLEMKAYVRLNVGVPGKTKGVMFSPIPLTVTYYKAERVAVDLLQQTGIRKGPVPIKSDLTRMEEMIGDLKATIERLVSYSQDVLDGKIAPDSAIGRMLMDIVSQVPHIEPTKYEQIMNSSMQDILMSSYLANLAKCQVLLRERIANLSLNRVL